MNTKEALAYRKAHTISDDEWNRRFKENKIVYSFLIDKFLQELEQDKVKYFTFLNIKQYLFKPENNNIKKREAFFFLKEALKDKNSFDPLKTSIEYLKEKNLYKEPWLTLPCTSTYSEVGNEFMSTYVSDIFHKNL